MSLDTKIIIAIDGFAACGKSTLAKALAHELHYGYIDTGAMYRATTLFLMQNGINWEDKEAVAAALPDVHIRFRNSKKGNRTYLNDLDVEEQIRSMAISDLVSEVSTVSSVRRAMVKQQQAMGKAKGIVMDGRDIGTVVFPQAELKLFITAQPEVRVQRRLAELQNKGIAIDSKTVLENLQHRDHIDSTRADSPLRQADDAITIDNSNLSPTEQLERALHYAKLAINV